MRPVRHAPSLNLPPPHVFDQGNPTAERNTRWAVLLTVVVMVAEIVEVIEQGPVAAEIVDFHVWRVGRGKYACILSLLVEEQVAPEQFKERLSVHDELVHVTVEVNQRPQLEAGA